MIPSHYGWHHPGWRIPSVHSPGPYMSTAPPTPSYYRQPPPLPPQRSVICCNEHSDQSYKLQKLEQEVDTLHTHVKSIFNYLAENELQTGRSVPEEVRASPSPSRKRKPNPEPEVKSTTEKRSKIIGDLEQKLADDRANNAKMEEKIVELRKQLHELRSRREEKERIAKKLRPLPERPVEEVNIEEVK